MKTKNNDFFIKTFLFASLWNISIGVIGIFFTDFSIGLFFSPDAVTSDFIAKLFFRLFMIAVIIFGTGYFIVSREITLNRGIVWMGLISKLILFVIFFTYYVDGSATIMALLAVTGDFLWSLIFILFLYQTAGRVKINTIIG